jgi:hypothetical protein
MTILMLRRFCEHGNDAGRVHHAATQRISAGVSLPAAQVRHAGSESEPASRQAPAGARRQAAAPVSCRGHCGTWEILAASMCRYLPSRSLFAAIQRCDSPHFFGQLWRKRYVKAMPPGY